MSATHQDWRVNRFRGGYALVRGSGKARERVSINARTREEAEREARDANLKTHAAQKGIRVHTTADIFAFYLEDRRRAGRDTRRMESAWKALRHHFQHLRPDQIDQDTCDDYIDQRRQQGVTDGGIRTDMTYLRQAFLKAAEKDVIAKAPHINRPPAGRPKQDYLTREEVSRLMEVIPTFHVKVFVILALATAGRPKHILELTWDRCDMARRIIYLDNPEKDRTQKGRATVPMSPEAYQTLTLARPHAATEFVIEHNGRPVQSVKKAIYAARDRAGLQKCSPYIFRHTAAVWMVEAGVPIEIVAQYLGHTNIEITRRHYARFSPGYMQQAALATMIQQIPAPTETEAASTNIVLPATPRLTLGD